MAAINQSNTGRSVIDDMNHYFREFRKEGICMGGHWESANTKSTVTKHMHNVRGREQLKLRLYNSTLCETPFNNRIEKNGLTKRLPTVWIFDNCTKIAKSLRNWRIENGKETVAWSHFCTALEFLLKDVRFHPRKASVHESKPIKHDMYFTKNRRW